MIDLQCMTVVSRTSSDILVGGLQTLMLLVNIERGTVINKLVIGGTVNLLIKKLISLRIVKKIQW